VARLSNLFRNPFSFLGTRSSKEERVSVYIIREHGRGRSLAEILEDPYVRNRCSREEIGRVLDRPELIRAIGDDIVESAKQQI
jgi:hypothetical protein